MRKIKILTLLTLILGSIVITQAQTRSDCFKKYGSAAAWPDDCKCKSCPYEDFKALNDCLCAVKEKKSSSSANYKNESEENEENKESEKSESFETPVNLTRLKSDLYETKALLERTGQTDTEEYRKTVASINAVEQQLSRKNSSYSGTSNSSKPTYSQTMRETQLEIDRVERTYDQAGKVIGNTIGSAIVAGIEARERREKAEREKRKREAELRKRKRAVNTNNFNDYVESAVEQMRAYYRASKEEQDKSLKEWIKAVQKGTSTAIYDYLMNYPIIPQELRFLAGGLLLCSYNGIPQNKWSSQQPYPSCPDMGTPSWLTGKEDPGYFSLDKRWDPCFCDEEYIRPSSYTYYRLANGGKKLANLIEESYWKYLSLYDKYYYPYTNKTIRYKASELEELLALKNIYKYPFELRLNLSSKPKLNLPDSLRLTGKLVIDYYDDGLYEHNKTIKIPQSADIDELEIVFPDIENETESDIIDFKIIGGQSIRKLHIENRTLKSLINFNKEYPHIINITIKPMEVKQYRKMVKRLEVEAEELVKQGKLAKVTFESYRYRRIGGPAYKVIE